MSLTRDEVPSLVSSMLEGRPARWAPANVRLADYDGAERTLQIFSAAPREQRRLLRVLGARRPEMEAAAGGPIVVVFHTPAESVRLYADVLSEWGPIDRSERPLRIVQYLKLHDAMVWKRAINAIDEDELARLELELDALLKAMTPDEARQTEELVTQRAPAVAKPSLGLVDAAPGETLESQLREKARTAA